MLDPTSSPPPPNTNRSVRYVRSLERRLARAEQRLQAIEGSRAWRIVLGYRRLRRLITGAVISPPVHEVDNTAPALETKIHAVDFDAQVSKVREALKRWVAAAKSAAGDEVVVMFSGTTSYQFRRANRPIRLSKVFLDQGVPVLFSYFRFNLQELPASENQLLLQSPIDITEIVLPEILAADFGDKENVLFASFPHQLMVRYLAYAALHGWTIVYDVRDDWEEFARVGAAVWYEPEFEWYVATHADVVTAVSRPLASKIELLAGRPVEVNRNALDPGFPRRQILIDSERPLIGYFGHLTEKWFDWSLMIRLARSLTNVSFELAGHQAPQLDLPDNISILGLLDHQQLATVTARWAGALIPFKMGPLTDAVDPIKVYEYLHLRLPTVSTYMPQLIGYPGVTVVESPEDFIAAVARLVESPRPLGDEVEGWLSENTWEGRVEQYRASWRSPDGGRMGQLTIET
ncbi:MAG TPA: hypothetical protein VJQ79_11385 [Acidimicrobiia bacterium]|nr:hypothetical protein [Acidimicrobiia bacterium]